MTPLPLAVTDRTAAAMLDMPAARFRRLVDAGVFPGPISIGGMERWRYADIEAIVSGKAAIPEPEDFEV